MLVELIDAGGENGDLDLGRTGVALVGRIFRDDSGLFFFLDHGCFHLSKNCPPAKFGMAEHSGFGEISRN